MMRHLILIVIYVFGSFPSHLLADFIVYKGSTVELQIPECPLAEGSLLIRPNDQEAAFANETAETSREVYYLAKKVAALWKKEGISDYLLIQKIAPSKSNDLEIVPFSPEAYAKLAQIKVLWNSIFGAPCLSSDERERFAKESKQQFDQFSFTKLIEDGPKSVKGSDVFCDPKVIEKQRVFEGQTINLLYNYAPIDLGDQLHFLITPKLHRESFEELSVEEFLEANQIAQKLIKYYQSRYPVAYLFNKSGARAGQTVFHWHQHVIFTEADPETLFNKLTQLKSFLLRTTPLPDKELKTRVYALKQELQFILKEARD